METATRNFLSRKDARILEDLITSHKKEILAGKWSQSKFAEMASGKLKRPVTAGNVKGAALAIGVPWTNVKYRLSIKATNQQALMKLVIRELISLKQELGQEIHPALLEVVRDESANGKPAATV